MTAGSASSDSVTPDVELIGVTKRFGPVVAVDHMNLAIPGGSFTSLLGPSGCGKTTTLRMIAGFEQPTEGEILLAGLPIAGVPPYHRNVNTVFQHYALFPHMDVAQNVGYGLRQRKVGRAEEQRRVDEALGLVRLTGYGKRRTWELSGGQQQRVALARALVNRPTVLLLDEPLGALDLKLRKEMQLELKALQQEVGITFVYVTHDQEEALTMSDMIVVMRDGLIQQQGLPDELYERPSNAFVANFIGVSNFIPARLVEHDRATGRAVVETDNGVRLAGHITDREAQPEDGATVTRDDLQAMVDWQKERRIAREIVKRRERHPFETTGELVDAIEAAIPAAVRRNFGGGHPAKRSFQAIRIAVNAELEMLEEALPLFTEGGALLLAALSVLLPPVGLGGLLGLLWLLFAGRGREQSKYAGLRILR